MLDINSFINMFTMKTGHVTDVWSALPPGFMTPKQYNAVSLYLGAERGGSRAGVPDMTSEALNAIAHHDQHAIAYHEQQHCQLPGELINRRVNALLVSLG